MNKQPQTTGSAKPDLLAKIKEQKGEHANFLPIGAAWRKEDGSMYVKLYGKLIIDQPFYLFPVNPS